MAAANAPGFKPERLAWQEVVQLLANGQYESAAALLMETGAATGSDVDPALVTILEATRQMCLAGNDYQAEAQFHREAYHTASEREQQLRQQLLAIVKLIAPGATLPEDLANEEVQAATSAPRRREIPGLLRRVQDLLGLNPENSTETEQEGASRAPVPPASGEEAAELPRAVQVTLPPMEIQAPPEPPPETYGPALAIYCLGSFRVYDNGRLIDDWTGNKSKSILKYLTLHREQPVHRDVLVDLFWRDDEPEAARRNLYQAIYMLRQALQIEGSDFQHILCENSCYLFNPELELTIDYEAFLTHYEAGQRHERMGRAAAAVREYEAAENLYEGEFLVGDLYEEWTLMLREQLKHAYLDMLDRVSRFYWSQNKLSLCIAYCQKILLADRCREDAHRRLMMAYMRQGHRHLALRQYHRCVEALQQELEAEPMPETQELYDKIKA